MDELVPYAAGEMALRPGQAVGKRGEAWEERGREIPKGGSEGPVYNSPAWVHFTFLPTTILLSHHMRTYPAYPLPPPLPFAPPTHEHLPMAPSAAVDSHDHRDPPQNLPDQHLSRPQSPQQPRLASTVISFISATPPL